MFNAKNTTNVTCLACMTSIKHATCLSVYCTGGSVFAGVKMFQANRPKAFKKFGAHNVSLGQIEMHR